MPSPWRTRSRLRYSLGNPIILEFLAGVLIALAPKPRWTIVAMPIGLALLVALHPLASHGDHPPAAMLAGQDMAGRTLIAGIPCALIILGALRLTVSEGALTELGDASYSIYLVHGAVVAGVLALVARVNWLPADLVIATATGSAVMLGWRVYVLFEKPVLAYLSRRPRPVVTA